MAVEVMEHRAEIGVADVGPQARREDVTRPNAQCGLMHLPHLVTRGGREREVHALGDHRLVGARRRRPRCTRPPLVDESARASRAFSDKLAARAEVQQCYGVTGERDFVLIVLVPDLAAYDAFCEACLLHDDNVRSFTTQVVLEAVKRGVGVALE